MQSSPSIQKSSRPVLPKAQFLRHDSKYVELTNVNRNLSQKDQITELQSRIFDLLGQLEEEKRRTAYVQQQAERREQRFAKKEVEFRRALKRYDDMFRELSGNDAGFGDLTQKNFERIGSMYKQIQSGLSELQDKRLEEMRKQEEDIIKIFDLRLREAEAQVEADKQKKLKQLGSIAEQDSKIGTQLELMKASVIMIEQKNTQLERDNKELKTKCSLLQEEAKLLVTKNCFLKKKSETARQVDLHLSTFQSLPGLEPKSPSFDQPMFSLPDEHILERQERIIIKLKRSLEQERSRLSAARSSYTNELNIRQDLRSLLKHCCDEVYSDLMIASEDKTDPSVKTAVVKTLESQMRMLTLIYDRVFQADSPRKAEAS